MARKKNRLFISIKKKFFFLCLHKSDPEKISKSWRLRLRWRWPFRMTPVPVLVLQPKTTLDEAIEEQRKQALTVAIDTASVAEAVIAAAHVAAEVVRLTGASSELKFRWCRLDSNTITTRIQSAFRARKALRVLKGLVKLQALLRGRAVRRRRDRALDFSTTSSQQSKPNSTRASASLSKERSQACENDAWISKFKKESLGGEESKIGCDSWRSWDHSTYSKLVAETGRQEQARTHDAYSYSQRDIMVLIASISPLLTMSPEGRNARITEDSMWRKQYSRWNLRDGDWDYEDTLRPSSCLISSRMGRYEMAEGWTDPDAGEITPCFLPRRSFGHAKNSSLADEIALPSTLVFPAYMAVTESARAKVRSTSTPRQCICYFNGNNYNHSRNRLNFTYHSGDYTSTT